MPPRRALFALRSSWLTVSLAVVRWYDYNCHCAYVISDPCKFWCYLLFLFIGVSGQRDLEILPTPANLFLFQSLDIIHQGRAGVPKKEVRAVLAKQFKVQDPQQVFVFGVQLQFGGGRSTAFATVYDNMTAAKKFEPKYRLVRVRDI